MGWIDPNLGMTDDAVKVYCNMTAGGETRVFPDVHASRMPNIPWRKSQQGWYSSLRGGFRISYDSLGPVQLTFLRLMSQNAYQNFTYTCLNSAAWYDASSASCRWSTSSPVITASRGRPSASRSGPSASSSRSPASSWGPSASCSGSLATRT